MGRIAKILSFTRGVFNGANLSEVKVDAGGGDTTTPQHFAPAGDDAHPLAGDYAAIVDVPRSGSTVTAGYLDPKNAQSAKPGEKRIYSRNESGEQVAEVWLQNDGTITSSNDKGSSTLAADGSIKGINENGSFELQAGGNFVVNGVIIDPNGNITTPGTLNADDVTADNENVTLSTHGHPGDGQPPTPGS